jgi:hypothetical protein
MSDAPKACEECNRRPPRAGYRLCVHCLEKARYEARLKAEAEQRREAWERGRQGRG